MLSGKRILLGVSGGIAAYKAVELLRRLSEVGAEVRVVMTRNAARFVGPLTFSALSGLPVLTDEFEEREWGAMGHIAVTEDLDLALLAPATANIIAKMASGIADDALTTSLLAASCPVLVAPAMNDRMYRHPTVQRNIAVLKKAGVRFVEPGTGVLACGSVGQGRLAETDDILGTIRSLFGPGDLAGLRVLVTAGPTREPIDAVRFISNPSSGRMGFALAEAARARGAEVVLISGPTQLVPPPGVSYLPVTTASEMYRAVMDRAGQCQIVIMAAAVSDFRPVEAASHKVRKEDVRPTIPLERTADILAELGRSSERRILVGFAAETGSILENARAKLERKNLDLIVANDVSLPGSGFASEMNKAILLDRRGLVTELQRMPKTELASRIMDRIAELKTNQGL